MKKFASVFLAFCLVMTVLVFPASAAGESYTLLEYATTDGRQYISTGMDSSTITGMEATLTYSGPMTSDRGYYFLGGQDAAKNLWIPFYLMYNSGVYRFSQRMTTTDAAVLNHVALTPGSATVTQKDEKYTVTSILRDGLQSFSVKSDRFSKVWDSANRNSVKDFGHFNAVLFNVSGANGTKGNYDGGQYGYPGNIYDVKLYCDFSGEKNSTVVRHYIPAISASGEVGMFDLFEGKFCPDEGSAGFAASASTYGMLRVTDGGYTFYCTDAASFERQAELAGAGDTIVLSADIAGAVKATLAAGVTLAKNGHAIPSGANVSAATVTENDPNGASGGGWSKADDWAKPYLETADRMGLIPLILTGADMTQQISRAEFAAICVKIYEKLSGQSAPAASANPFTDCADGEVLKAYALGITTGTSATTFAPYATLTREQAATMLTRAYKAAKMPGWTIDTDAFYVLTYPAIGAFADRASISAWATESIYFMAGHGIINGVGNNRFAPQNTATRQEALKIAACMAEALA